MVIKMKKVLVTGGSGFIGSKLVPYLCSKGYRVEAPNSKELNVLHQADWTRWEKQDISHVIHLAGRTFVPASWEHPEEYFTVNIAGTLQALQFCWKRGVSMTYISAYIYGQPERDPISESDRIQPNNPYAASKYLAEEICAFYGEYFHVNTTVLRLFNVYGYGQNERFLIPSVIKQALNSGEEITVSDLEPKRDYVHIDDVCNVIELSIRNTNGYHVFNVGSGRSYSVREIIDKVQKIAQTKKAVLSKQQARRNELDDVTANIDSIKNIWGWTPTVSIDNGLQQYIEEERLHE